MSQEKVDKYKKEKANRKKNIARRKVRNRLVKTIAGVALVVIVAWTGYSGYNYYESTRPVEKYYVDISDMADYISSVSYQ